MRGNRLHPSLRKVEGVWVVITASYPGPGLGGHCIPIDPFYVTWKAREYDFPTRFIEIATDHSTYDYAAIVRHARLVIDTRNATHAVRDHREKIVRC